MRNLQKGRAPQSGAVGRILLLGLGILAVVGLCVALGRGNGLCGLR